MFAPTSHRVGGRGGVDISALAKFSFGDVYPYLRDVYHYLTQSRGMRG